MEQPPRGRSGGGAGGPQRGRGAPRHRGRSDRPQIPTQLPQYAPQRSSTASEVGFVVNPPPGGPVSFSSAGSHQNVPDGAVSPSPRGRGGRGGNRGRGRGRGRGISTTSRAPASPAPHPSLAPSFASAAPAPGPVPVTPSAKPILAPRQAQVKHQEIHDLREAKANGVQGYEHTIVATVEKMLSNTKHKPSQPAKVYMLAALRTFYGPLVPPTSLCIWIEALVKAGDFGLALSIIEYETLAYLSSGKLIERIKYDPSLLTKAAMDSLKHRHDAVNFICKYPSNHGLTISQILIPLFQSGEWMSLLRVASVLNLPAFSDAVLRKLDERNVGLSRAWAEDLLPVLPKDLARLMLNPLSLATLSPGSTTYWIDTTEGISALAAVLLQQKRQGGLSLQKRGVPFSLILGLDVESRPSFQQGQRNRPSILQLSSFITIALIDLHAPQVLAQFYKSFAPLFAAPDVVVCGAGIWNDFAELERPPHAAVLPPMSCVLDLSEAFLALWPGFVQKPGLKRLVAYALGMRLNKSKAVQTSNWDNRPLTQQQISYAAEDVNVLPHVASVLLEQLPPNSPVLQAAVARPRKGSKEHTVLAPVKRLITP